MRKIPAPFCWPRVDFTVAGLPPRSSAQARISPRSFVLCAAPPREPAVVLRLREFARIPRPRETLALRERERDFEAAPLRVLRRELPRVVLPRPIEPGAVLRPPRPV